MWKQWHQDESGGVHTPLEPVVLGATLALIPVLIIEADATSDAWQGFATVANWVIWAIFPTELAAVLIVAERAKAGPSWRRSPRLHSRCMRARTGRRWRR
jgi:hypothetical protein